MHRNRAAILAILVVGWAQLLATTTLRSQSILEPGFVEEFVLDAGGSPATLAFAPDGRMFVGERIAGRLWVATPDATAPGGWRRANQPFFTFDVPKNSNGDPMRHRSSGLRDVAFHPNFPAEPWVYAFYMQNAPRHNRVVRVRASATDLSAAMPGSLEVVFDVPFNGSISSGSHNGGSMEFGADGKLYVATGDGWNGGDAVQSLSTFTGKVLRLDADGSIPQDNAFFAQANGNYRAIHAIGCRNPFSMSVDPTDGALFLNETRGADKTEVYRVAPGANFGHQGFGGLGAPASPYATLNVGGKLNTGGAWYVPSFPGQTNLPFPASFRGSYFVAQWGSNGGSPRGSIARLESRADPTPSLFATNIQRSAGKPVLTRVGPDGHLYFLLTDYEVDRGEVWRLRWQGGASSLVAPVMDPSGGNFPVSATVSLSHPDPGVTVRYTLDGATPSTSSTVYTSPFVLTSSTTVRARAFSATQQSAVVEAFFAVGVPDIPPVALAGPDFVWPRGRLVTLNGSASFDPDGDDAALTDRWVQTGGPPLPSEFDGEDFLSFFTPHRAGTYTFRLDVGDLTTVSTDDLSIDVVPCLDEVLDGLSARWAFDEQVGTQAGDSSAGAAHGSIDGAAWSARTPQPTGAGSLEFDGVDDRVTIPRDVGATGTSLTISLWFRADDFGVVDGRLLSKAEGSAAGDHDVMLSTFAGPANTQVLRARLRVGGVTTTLIASAVPISGSQWHHTALVYDGAFLRVFVDGQLAGSQPLAGNLTWSPARALAIGNQPAGAGARAFDGVIDDVRFYARALDAVDFARLRSPTLGTVPTGCFCAADVGGETADGAALSVCSDESAVTRFRIDNGPPGSPLAFLFGTSEGNLPFGGGIVVPAAPAFVPWIPLPPTGATSFPLPIAASEMSVTVYMQAVHMGTIGMDLALSNAVRIGPRVVSGM